MGYTELSGTSYLVGCTAGWGALHLCVWRSSSLYMCSQLGALALGSSAMYQGSSGGCVKIRFQPNTLAAYHITWIGLVCTNVLKLEKAYEWMFKSDRFVQLQRSTDSQLSRASCLELQLFHRRGEDTSLSLGPRYPTLST